MLRRILALLLLLLAGALLVRSVRPDQGPATTLVVAARDLPAGTTLRPPDLATRVVPRTLAPPGALASRAAAGRVLTAPLAAGEPLTRTRVVATSVGAGPGGGERPAAGVEVAARDGAARADAVAVHLVVADERGLDLTPPGTLVTLYPHTGGPPVARGVPVLTVDPPRPPDDGILSGGAAASGSRGLVVSLDPEVADALFAGQRPEGGPPVVLAVPSLGVPDP